MSVLRQNLLHAGLFRVCHEAEPPGMKTRHVRTRTEHGEARGGSAHASFPSPRSLGNGIPHHHTLLHLSKFAEVLLQTLCKDTVTISPGGGVGGTQCAGPWCDDVAGDRQWGSGGPRCVYVPPPYPLKATNNAALGDDCCFLTLVASARTTRPIATGANVRQKLSIFFLFLKKKVRTSARTIGGCGCCWERRKKDRQVVVCCMYLC